MAGRRRGDEPNHRLKSNHVNAMLIWNAEVVVRDAVQLTAHGPRDPGERSMDLHLLYSDACL